MPRKGGKRKKTRTHAEALLPAGATNEKDNIPRSIVARANKVTPSVAELIRDLRKVMSPYTASNLRERSYNRTKDYASIASQFGITHLLAFSETEKNIILRIAKFQNGPTLHFRVPQYCLSRLVRNSQKRPFDSNAAFLTPPLIVLNNFGQTEESHLKLLRVTLQNMFPSINVNTVRLNECRRVVLFQFVKETQIVEMRHYAIRATPVGINKNINRILQAKIPNLGKLKDISEFLEENAGYGGQSDSEAEDDPTTRVELAERYVGKGNGATQQSAMKLTELGPRLNLELFKVESGLCEGDILYHKFQTKTPEEAERTKKRIEEMKRLKEERKQIQNQNVQKKKELFEQKRKEKEEKKKRKLEEYEEDHQNDENDDNDDKEQEDNDNDNGYGEENEDQEDYENYDEGDNDDNNEEDEVYQDEDLDDGSDNDEEYQEEDFS